VSAARLGRRDLRDLAAWAEPLGFRWRHTGSGHIRWDHPQVRRPVFTASTPRRSGMATERAKLRRALRLAEREGVPG
jgi:hypothetical protein